MSYDNEHYARAYENTTSNDYRKEPDLPSGYTRDNENGYLSKKYKDFVEKVNELYKDNQKVKKFFQKACPSVYKNGNKKLFQQGFLKLHTREISKVKREFNKIWNNYCNNQINNTNDLQNKIKDVFNKHKKFFGIA